MFTDRVEAGRLLAERLEVYRGERPVVLALPRGGVPIGYQVAVRLDAPLDVIVVRKIGAPHQEELAVGAVVDGANPVLVLNDDLVRETGATEAYIARQQEEKLREIARRNAIYRNGRTGYEVKGRTVLLVDDGIATGATVRAAIKALRQSGPRRLVLAVPVAAADTAARLVGDVDALVCLEMPTPFFAVGAHYENFPQVSDDEVIGLLDAAARRTTSSTGT